LKVSADGFVALENLALHHVNRQAASLFGRHLKISSESTSGRNFRKVSVNLSFGLRESDGETDLHSDGELL
jgi:hypothetical protein